MGSSVDSTVGPAVGAMIARIISRLSLAGIGRIFEVGLREVGLRDTIVGDTDCYGDCESEGSTVR